MEAIRLLSIGGLVLLISVAMGCRARCCSDDLAITPGIGISNVLQLSYSFTDVRKQLPDATIERDGNSALVKIPSLGCTGQYSVKDSCFSSLQFVVHRKNVEPMSPSYPMCFFSGSVSSRLSFSNTVTRTEITNFFGRPLVMVDSKDTPNRALLVEFEKLKQAWSQGHAVEHYVSAADSIIYYPTLGLAFGTQGGRIESIRIMKPVDGVTDQIDTEGIGVSPERRVARIPLSGLSDSIFVQPLSASANNDKERG